MPNDNLPAVVPYRHIMRPVECAYCGLDDYDLVDQTMIEYLFGIRHCADHKAWAERDCNAFLHKVGQVPMWSIEHLPALKSLYDLSGVNFTITRSSGEEEGGWSINYGSLDQPLYITQEGEEWLIPMVNNEINKMKGVRISRLQETHPILAEARAALEAGVYKTDYERQMLLEMKPLREDPAVQTVMREDGQIGRIYIGHLQNLSINQ